MKKAIAYHGSSAEFDEFSSDFQDKRHQNYGKGFYLADSPEKAKLYGDYVYEVEVAYSTDLRTSKKTGREKDFQFSDETGYWVIPHDKAGNLKIIRRTDTSKMTYDQVAKMMKRGK